MNTLEKEQEWEYVMHEYQVNKPNGDTDFIEVYDLPEQVARKFVKNKYPNCEISLFKTRTKD